MKIDKGVPLLPSGKYHKIVLEMEDGDSVLCTEKEAGAFRSTINKYCPGYKAKMRICRDEFKRSEHGHNLQAYRVWKVKKDE
tara:strand:- start:214 stop:459 length:246 start_codon:yes stop_codon:yes gene_type:complete